MADIDYKSFGIGAPPKRAEQAEDPRARWWRLKEKDCARSISTTLGTLRDAQRIRLTQLMLAARMYGNMPPPEVYGLTLSRIAAAQPAVTDRLTFNLVEACVDTAVAKMGKNRPRPLFLTSGGDYKAQRRAQKLSKFIEGVFYENKAYRLGRQCMRDAAVCGDGLIKVFVRNGRLAFERCMSAELWVDEQEALRGNPRQLHQVILADRDALAERFPDKRALIENAARVDTGDASKPTISNVLEVRESWHLPSGPDAKDGLRVVSIEEGVLESEEWRHNFFPFARFPWLERQWGFWSKGGAEQLQNIQFELNRLLIKIQESMQLMGTFKIFLPRGSRILKQYFNNLIGAIIDYTGEKPEYIAPPAVNPELYLQVERLIRLGFEQFGLSQLSATSLKPVGLNSGRALREFNDIESDRFHTHGMDYEDFFIDLARICVEVAKDLHASGGGSEYLVKAPGARAYTPIKWSEVDLARDSYVLQCFPVSSLPNDPAGRMATIQEWVQAGWITPRQGRRLMHFPDLEAVESLASAAEEYIEMVLDRIVDEGVYTAPEPYDDLVMAHEMALLYYAHGKAHGLEAGRRELLRRYIGQVDALKKRAAAEAAAMLPAIPQGVPPQPPMSELMPQAV